MIDDGATPPPRSPRGDLLPEPIEAETERYLHDWQILRDGGLVEIDPRNAGSLAAFQDACEEQQRRLRGDA